MVQVEEYLEVAYCPQPGTDVEASVTDAILSPPDQWLLPAGVVFLLALCLLWLLLRKRTRKVKTN